MTVDPSRPLVHIASYNTNLQAERGLSQDLVDWLAPTHQVSNFLGESDARPTSSLSASKSSSHYISAVSAPPRPAPER